VIEALTPNVGLLVMCASVALGAIFGRVIVP